MSHRDVLIDATAKQVLLIPSSTPQGSQHRFLPVAVKDILFLLLGEL